LAYAKYLRPDRAAFNIVLVLRGYRDLAVNLSLRRDIGKIADQPNFWRTDLPEGGHWAKTERHNAAVTLQVLIPAFDGALFSMAWKEALSARFYTGAPPQRRRSVERYSIVKRA